MAGFWPTGEPSGPGSWSEMRASDADRDRVMEVLRVAARDGRLTPDELDERLEAALSSRTLGELAVLTADLVPGPSMPGAAMAQAEDVIRIDQRGGSVRRTGRWVVPRRLELRSSWCDVWLDFTDALTVRYADVKIGPAAEPGAPIVLRVQLVGRMRYGWIEQR